MKRFTFLSFAIGALLLIAGGCQKTIREAGGDERHDVIDRAAGQSVANNAQTPLNLARIDS